MTADQINAAIRRDLQVDAYAQQREQMIPFRGKRLAEGLETTLCLCPCCGRLGTLKSEDDRFFCSCGLALRYTPYGFLEGEGAPFDNITDWDRWQTGELLRLCAEEDLVPEDDAIVLTAVGNDHSEEELGQGRVRLSRDTFHCCGRDFPRSSISAMAMQGAQRLHFTSGERHYQLSSPQRRCLRKYMTVMEHPAPLSAPAEGAST